MNQNLTDEVTIEIPPKSQAWQRFLVILTLLNIIAILGTIIVLWMGLSDYERNLPKKVVSQLITQWENGDYSLLQDVDGFKLSVYENENTRNTYLKNRFNPEGENKTPLKITEDRSKLQSGILSYKISRETPIARITLRKTDELSMFKNAIYKLELVEGVYEKRPPTIIKAPENTKLLINGKPILESEKTLTPIPKYQSLPEQYSPPEVITYTIEGLLAPVDVTIGEGAEGFERAVENDHNLVTFSRIVSEEIEAKIRTRATETAELYARFISRDATFDMLRPYLLPKAHAYKNMMYFDNRWYVEHDAYAFREMKTDNFVEYGENYISCEVTFDYVITKGRKEYIYPTHYELAFMRSSASEPFLLVQLTVK